jgi:hypothetical protein
MSNFDSSHWADNRFAKDYRDQADGYVDQRQQDGGGKFLK